MLRGIVATLLVMCASTAAFAALTIAQVQLSCDSRSQVLSPNGTQVAVRCKDRSLRLINTPSGTERIVASADRVANTFAYSPDGGWLAMGFDDGSVEVISTNESASARHWKAGSRRIDVLYFFPDAKMLFVGPVDSPGQVWLLTETPTQRASLPTDFGGIAVCAVSPDGKLLVAAGDDTVLRWYDTTTWQKTRETRDFLLETFALEFTLDGKRLLVGGADSRVTVLDAASGKQVRQIPPEAGSFIVDVHLLGDQQRVVVVYADDAGEKPPHALLWDLSTEKSTPIKSDSQTTGGGVVNGKLWLCTTQGRTLTISQQE